MDEEPNTIEIDLKKFINQLQKSDEEKSEDVIRFFQTLTKKKNDESYTYKAYGKDALFIAQEFDKTETTLLKYDNFVATRAIVEPKYKRLVRDLLLFKGKKVEVYEKKKDKTFEKILCGSPGNYQMFEGIIFDDEYESSSTNSIVMSIYPIPNTNVVGVAYCNSITRTIGMCEFFDNEHYTNIESAIIQTGTKEIIMASTEKKEFDAKFKDIATKCIITITYVSKKTFKQTISDISEKVSKILQSNEKIPNEYDIKNAMYALGALMEYLNLSSDSDNYGYFKYKTLNLSQFMKLDNSVLKALNIMRSPHESKNMSLYGLLDICKTKIGSRKLEEWIRQPLLDLEDIERRLDMVEAFIEDNIIREKFRNGFLKKVPDLDSILKRFQRMKGSLKDAVKLYSFVTSLEEVIDTLSQHDSVHKELIQNVFVGPLKEIYSDFGGLIKIIGDTVDLNRTDDDEYLINPMFDDELDQLREKRDEVESQIEGLLQRVADHLGVEVTRERNSKYGYIFRCPLKYESQLEDFDKTIQRIPGGKKLGFTFSDLKDLSGEYDEIVKKYTEQQDELVKKLIRVIASYIPVAEDLSRLFVHLDILMSFAEISCNAPIPYVRPTIKSSEYGKIIMKNMRHPCLEVQEGISFMPNDIDFDRKKKSFYVITGPNMGGKSTYIRSIAINILMAQIGCFIPCENAVISVRDAIYARIGASDSQLRGLSTFMAEMLDTSCILKNASENSLILIDELGRGTSNYDGFGLAWAICREIVSKNKSFSLFATHFHELHSLESIHEEIGNKHVSAQVDDNKITMLYKVEEGEINQSFGINVAILAKFPNCVIKLSEKRARELENYDDEDEEEKPKKKSKEEIEKENKIRKSLIEFCRLDIDKGDYLEILKKIQSKK